MDTHFYPLKTPILFLIFNRMDETKEVFEAIRKAKPSKLYIASDGARELKAGERYNVESVRTYVTKNIDWPCEVKTLFRENNLGCKVAVSGAIDWFFNNEEMGIILEDDCLPSQSFFRFCEDLLVMYKNEPTVWQITGDNFQDGMIRGKSDYYFSHHVHIWGWATWRDRWKAYDVELKSFKHHQDKRIFKRIFKQSFLVDYWLNIMSNLQAGKIDTWDYQWMYAIWSNQGVCVLPNYNLVSNIGFNNNATHTKTDQSGLSRQKSFELNFPLTHPQIIIEDLDADEWTNKKFFKKPNFLARTRDLVKKVINR